MGMAMAMATATAMAMDMGMGMGSTFGKSTDSAKKQKSQNWLAWSAKCLYTPWESFAPPKPLPTPIWSQNQKILR